MRGRAGAHVTGDELMDDWVTEPITSGDCGGDGGDDSTDIHDGDVANAKLEEEATLSHASSKKPRDVPKRPREGKNDELDSANEGGLPSNIEAKRKRREKEKARRRAKVDEKCEMQALALGGTPSSMAQYYAAQVREAFGKSLSPIELEDFSIRDCSFLGSPSGFETQSFRSLEQIEGFIKALNSKWETDYQGVIVQEPEDADGNRIQNKAMRKKLKKLQAESELFADPGQSKKGAPRLVIVTASGIQTMNIIRSLPELHSMCRVGKMFAKHMKLEEQEEWLRSNIVRIVVGTPNRLLKLLDSGAMSKEALGMVILDASGRDQKNRSIFQINEIRQDLFRLFKAHIKKSRTKVAFF